MQGKPTASATQKIRQRATVSYPYHPLDLCLKVAEAVKEIGNGRQDVDKSVLAAHMKVDAQSADFAQKIASSKTYGLLDGKTTLQLTEAAKEYFFPTHDPASAKAAGLLKFFYSPTAFQVLIDSYDGSKPPALEIMGNVLSQKYGVPESWKLRVATFFLRAGNTAGAIEPDGFIRYKAKLKGSGGRSELRKPLVHGPDHEDLAAPPSDPPPEEKDKPGVNVWKYSFQGSTFRIETPENMTKELWEKLNKYLQVIQP